ncbi:MAG: cytochrome c oxidase subunit II [Betaproteobacteria bacterium]|nr:cytochrome c oxidase subunit II [Betaproteobacteria bacterium]
MIGRWMNILTAGLITGLWTITVAAQSQVDFQTPQSPVAREVYDLHLIILGICVVIFVGVFGVMLYSIVKHRKSVGHKAAHFHENTTVEVIWTVAPLIVLVLMMIPSTKVLLLMRDASSPDMTIKATGYQWKWGYEYLQGEGEGIRFYSTLATPRDQIEGRAPKGQNYLLDVDNPVVVPVGKKVRVLTTAQDVIHSWSVPALGVKQDANPGFIRDAWFKADTPGVYRGQCTELCGKDHGFMPIVVQAVSPEKYTAWVAGQKKMMVATAVDPGKQWTLDELKARGAKVYSGNCVACHQATGKGIPPTFPALSGSQVVNGPKEGQINVLLNGVVKQGKPTAMVSFKHLSDADLAAVITYTRNSWENKTGEAVMPVDVKTQRK